MSCLALAGTPDHVGAGQWSRVWPLCLPRYRGAASLSQPWNEASSSKTLLTFAENTYQMY